jgi:hypothetical protein
MPSEFNIDDLFRSKENSCQLTAQHQDAHWQQMQSLLSTIPATGFGKKFRIMPSSRTGRWFGASAVVAVITVAVIISQKGKDHNAATIPEIQYIVTDSSNRKLQENDYTPVQKNENIPAAAREGSDKDTGKTVAAPDKKTALPASSSKPATAVIVSEKKTGKDLAERSAPQRIKSSTNTPVNKHNRPKIERIHTPAVSRPRRIKTANQPVADTAISRPGLLLKSKQATNMMRSRMTMNSAYPNKAARDTTIKKIPGNIQNESRQLAAFFEAMQKTGQIIEISGTQDTAFESLEGTRFRIPASAFVNGKQQPITGTIRIRISEFYQYDDIIRRRLSTSSNGNLLVTGGMFHISAESGGETLFIQKEKNIAVDMPLSSYDERMQLFTGNERFDVEVFSESITGPVKLAAKDHNGNAIDSIMAYPVRSSGAAGRSVMGAPVDWQPAGHRSIKLMKADGTELKEEKPLKDYRFQITRMGWHNWDRFYSEPGRNIHFTIDLGQGVDARSFVSQLVFRRFKSVLQPTSYSGSKLSFTRIPINEPVELVSVGMKDGKIVSCIQTFRTTEEVQAGTVFEETTPEAFSQKLKKLNTNTP